MQFNHSFFHEAPQTPQPTKRTFQSAAAFFFVLKMYLLRPELLPPLQAPNCSPSVVPGVPSCISVASFMNTANVHIYDRLTSTLMIYCAIDCRS